ncbi:histone-lysine N-methyltransferase trr [Drosophila guanche]|uniref:Blast:Histone-lysine N-methyltransferase trr n=1 Tax=Drosophila guanche TaxID=7266 RepID=A0A3B0KTA4_DROGU|nr:histone-lysine N-methyltransferase trr [Drosophila guanche]SPP89969.1 blast:Histone-lysine N-methyltransferase trr [Drosophila guanche]
MNISKVTTSLAAAAAAAEKAKPERVISATAALNFNAINIQKRTSIDDTEDPNRKKLKTEFLLCPPSTSLPAKQQQLIQQQKHHQHHREQQRAVVAGGSVKATSLAFQVTAAAAASKQTSTVSEKSTVDQYQQQHQQVEQGDTEDVWDPREDQIIVCNFAANAEMSALIKPEEVLEGGQKQSFTSFTKKEAVCPSSASSSSSMASTISIEPSGGAEHVEQANKTVLSSAAVEELDYALLPSSAPEQKVVPENSTIVSVSAVSAVTTSSVSPVTVTSSTTSTIILNASTTNNGGGSGPGVAGSTIMNQKSSPANYNIFSATTASGQQQVSHQPTLLNRVNIQSKMKGTQLVVNTKKLSEVTQTTAKVSIGNKTISVPLLMSASGAATAGGATIVESKQIMQPGGQVTAVASVAPSGQQSSAHQHHPQHQHLNYTKLIKRVPKNPTTIVSFSGLQIKPANTKIVTAKVVSKKMSLQIQQQHQLQQVQHQQAQQLVNSASMAPATASIVSITTTNPNQTFAMVKEKLHEATEIIDTTHESGVGVNVNSSRNPTTRLAGHKIAYSDNIFNKSKSQDSGVGDEFGNSVVIKPLDKVSHNCSPSLNTFKQQPVPGGAGVAAVALNQTTGTVPVTVTMTSSASGSAPDQMTNSTSSVSVSSILNEAVAKSTAGTICINTPGMGARPIISIQNKNISLVLSKTTMAQQKPKMITTTVSSSALQMHHALNQDPYSAKQSPSSSSSTSPSASVVSVSVSTPAPMQLKLTSVPSVVGLGLGVVTTPATTPTKLGVSLAAAEALPFSIIVPKLDELCNEPKTNLLAKQKAIVKDAPVAPPTAPLAEQAGEVLVAPEKRLNATTTLTANTAAASAPDPPTTTQTVTSATIPTPTPTATPTNAGTEASGGASAAATGNSSQRLNSDDSNNALLKQLLQNSSSSHSHNLNQISINSAHVAASTAPLSARKVINVRAPSMGLVSSLEAQLARPVIPPVPAAVSSSGGSVATPTTTTTVANGNGNFSQQSTAAGPSAPPVAPSVAASASAPNSATTEAPVPPMNAVAELEQQISVVQQSSMAQQALAQPQPTPPPPAAQQQIQHQPQHQVKQTVQIVSKETSFISTPPTQHAALSIGDRKLTESSGCTSSSKPAEFLPPPPYELATAPVSNVTISISTKPSKDLNLHIKHKSASASMSMPMAMEQESLGVPLSEQAEQPPTTSDNLKTAATSAAVHATALAGAGAGAASITNSWSRQIQNNNSNIHIEAGIGQILAPHKITFKSGEAQKRKLPMQSHPLLGEKDQLQHIHPDASHSNDMMHMQMQLPGAVGMKPLPPGTNSAVPPGSESNKLQLISAITSYVKKTGQPGEAPHQAQMQSHIQGQMHVHQQQQHQQQVQLQVSHSHAQAHPQSHPQPNPQSGPMVMEPKAGDQRKRRKRDVQKPRRGNHSAGQSANSPKDLSGTLPAGAMVQLARMPPGTQYIQGSPGTGHVASGVVGVGCGSGGGSSAAASHMLKKRVRKFSKVEEDHDAFTEKLLTHIRQMQPLQVLEPHLNRNFHFLVGNSEMAGAGTGSGSGRCNSGNGKLKSIGSQPRGWPLEECDGAQLGHFGRVRHPSIPSLYDSERFGGSGGPAGGSASPSGTLGGVEGKSQPMSNIQNDFYDQEFSTHIDRNPSERLLRHIGAVKDSNLETIELVEGESVTAWTALPRLTRFPGLILLNNNSRCHGRMSPVALAEDPLSMRMPTSPLLRNCAEELRKGQQMEMGLGGGYTHSQGSLNSNSNSNSNNNNNNYQQKNQNVILSLHSSTTDNIAGVLRDLANLLHLTPALTCKLIEEKADPKTGAEPSLEQSKGKGASDEDEEQAEKEPFKRPHSVSNGHLRKILNGRRKLCRSCANVVPSSGLQVPNQSMPPLEEQLPRLAQLMALLPRKTPPPPFFYFCNRACLTMFKWSEKETQAKAEAASISLLTASGSSKSIFASGSSPPVPQDNVVKTEPPEEEMDAKQNQHTSDTPATPLQRKCIVKCFSSDCFATESSTGANINQEWNEAVTSFAAPSYTVWETDVVSHLEDTRQCVFCNQRGDGQADGPSRLLNFDVDKWVHLNCALWSNGVYETVSGALMNFQTALQAGLNQVCSACHQLGATIKCFKSRCNNLYHLPCAIREECVFYKNKSVHCSAHGHCHTQNHASSGSANASIAAGSGSGSGAAIGTIENELSSFIVHRRVFVDRDENRQVATVMHYTELSNLLRVGNMTFLNVGQLLPHQLEAFHTPHFIYPIGYKVSRYYWCVRRPNRRCRYICSIAEAGCKPEFRIVIQDGSDKEPEREFQASTPSGVWQQILQPITRLRKMHKWLQLFPQHISGEDLFGLTEPAIVRILESLPGIETLTDYRFKYGRNPLLEFPLAINPSGAARTEPKQRQLLVWRKPHTQRTAGSCSTQRMANSASIAGEVACPYSKQFVHSKSSQYKKMKQEWRNNVYLARSKIQGLGLYAARDIEKHTMIIEYIGEVIRTEVSEIREKQYESKNRGIYMFRLDEDRVVDATLSGGLARYINHSCNPNCVTEIVEVDRDVRIIIFAKRKIYRGEELSYDYKFDIEDDAHKIPCACGAPNCRKWMN